MSGKPAEKDSKTGRNPTSNTGGKSGPDNSVKQPADKPNNNDLARLGDKVANSAGGKSAPKPKHSDKLPPEKIVSLMPHPLPGAALPVDGATHVSSAPFAWGSAAVVAVCACVAIVRVIRRRQQAQYVAPDGEGYATLV